MGIKKFNSSSKVVKLLEPYDNLEWFSEFIEQFLDPDLLADYDSYMDLEYGIAFGQKAGERQVWRLNLMDTYICYFIGPEVQIVKRVQNAIVRWFKKHPEATPEAIDKKRLEESLVRTKSTIEFAKKELARLQKLSREKNGKQGLRTG